MPWILLLPIPKGALHSSDYLSVSMLDSISSSTGTELNTGSVDLPVIVDNEYIKKTEILPQPESDPPLAIAAAVTKIEIYMVLEQVSSLPFHSHGCHIEPFPGLVCHQRPIENTSGCLFPERPANQPQRPHEAGADATRRCRYYGTRQASTRPVVSTINGVEQIERHLPSYLSQVGVKPNASSSFLFSCRVRTVFQFVRTLIARQTLIDELESGVDPAGEDASLATLDACRLSVDTVKTYSRLRHLGLLRFCGFHAVSHVTAAAHTLIACMLRSSNLALEHRPDLLTAIDILLVFSSLFPHAETVAQLLVQLSRNLDHNHGSNTQSEAVAIRVLARRMARSASAEDPSVLTPPLSLPSWKGDSIGQNDAELLHSLDSTLQPACRDEATIYCATDDTGSSWLSSTALDPLVLDPMEPQWMSHDSDHKVWGDSFSFLNDGLFSKL